MSDEIERIREWRDYWADGSAAVKASKLWAEVNILLTEIDRLHAVPRTLYAPIVDDQAMAIVRALAASDPTYWPDDRSTVCALCDSECMGTVSSHAESCPWRLARELIGDSDAG